MLENGRFAVRFLADDLQMADFWGYYMVSDDIDNEGPTDTICGVRPFKTSPSGTTISGAVHAG